MVIFFLVKKCMLRVFFTLFLASFARGDVASLLREGDKLLIQGRSSYPAAVAKYSQAIALEGDNAKALFRRAELYFMMKEWEKAGVDVDAVLHLEPQHKKALEIRMKLRASSGLLTEAAADARELYMVWSKEGNKKKADAARDSLHKLEGIGAQWGHVKARLKQSGLSFDEKKEVNGRCVQLLRDLIQDFAKDNLALRLQRAECALASRQQQALTEELKHILSREPHNLRALLLNAQGLRSLGAIDRAKAEIKRCLALDPEFEGCAKLHKSLKQYAKQVQTIEHHVNEKAWNHVVKEVEHAMAMEEDPPNIEQLASWRCEGFVHMRKVTEGLAACDQAIKLEGGNDDKNPQLITHFLHRADLHILNDDIDAAEADVRRAADINQQNEKVQEYRGKIERLRRQASLKDYYGILGVKRTASEKDIRRAFRKLSMKYHPDQMRSKDLSEKDRKKNDQRYRDINEAKEVLLNEEKRRRYDAGEDVTKPPEQQGGPHFGFQGFPGGFNPFGGGGGPGNFHFRFG